MHAAGTGVMRACHTAVELFKNVAERGPWAKMLMEAHDFYQRSYIDVAMLKYLVAAELGYEVAQSNVGYLLDSGQTDAFKDKEKYRRALLQWRRAASQGKHSASDIHVNYPSSSLVQVLHQLIIVTLFHLLIFWLLMMYFVERIESSMF